MSNQYSQDNPEETTDIITIPQRFSRFYLLKIAFESLKTLKSDFYNITVEINGGPKDPYILIRDGVDTWEITAKKLPKLQDPDEEGY